MNFSIVYNMHVNISLFPFFFFFSHFFIIVKLLTLPYLSGCESGVHCNVISHYSGDSLSCNTMTVRNLLFLCLFCFIPSLSSYKYTFCQSADSGWSMLFWKW